MNSIHFSLLILFIYWPINCLAGSGHHHPTISIVNVATPICPSGFNLEAGNICVGFEELQPERICTNGATLTSDLMCLNTISPVMHCPINYSLIGENMCQRVIETPPIAVCPIGFTITDGQMCTGSKTISPIKSCTSGVLGKSQDECIVQKTVSPIAECPSSEYTLLNNNQCSREILYDCTPPPRIAIEGHHHHHHHYITAIPTQVVARTCSKVETVPAILNCPPGSVSDSINFGCTITTSTQPIDICPGNSMMSNGQCVEVITVPAELECPPKKVPIPTKSNVYDGKFHSLENAEVNSLQNIQTLNTDTQYAYNDSQSSFIPQAMITRRKLAKRGHHHHYIPTIPAAPTPVVSQKVIVQPQTKKCEEFETIPGELICPEGFTDKADKGLCQSLLPATLNCPAGSKINESGKCIKRITAEATILTQQQQVLQTYHHHHH
ncbi:uncharacterized protein CMU_028010 [Cryptosporidium muris RN66]|uniref:Oocyst wall protein n=1 Tax=Cryptosporidium muris (strain RN66) TaxID=441375 RepID=B6ABN9_CRYMR|nr:uncharacterized protein CMU_028010 [Cryptosporidium muris RN66]EEA05791.1 hypothetical protein, conserved [Cryptosporidium muris RN66]|eukprot:XP_002140140.1 hypothetical protein [Cryptosporidium muris RN66]